MSDNIRDNVFSYLPKDFIETKEGLIFAVVSYQPHDGKVACFLRYVRNGNTWSKVNTEQANKLLQDNYPYYYYKSAQFDAVFHAVAIKHIIEHHQPEQRLEAVLQREPNDEVERKLHRLIPILVALGVNRESLGLTGSMLINQQGPESDIDLVVYGRDAFKVARSAVEQGIAAGQLDLLDAALMEDNFNRRLAELSREEFTWHENRKFNKAAIEGCKFDIGMVNSTDEVTIDNEQYQKRGKRTFIATVSNDDYAFDFPAVYTVDDELTAEVISYTHTYVGQAKKGEKIEVSGAIECNVETGKCRLIVGSTREAQGEYIKVIE